MAPTEVVDMLFRWAHAPGRRDPLALGTVPKLSSLTVCAGRLDLRKALPLRFLSVTVSG